MLFKINCGIKAVLSLFILYYIIATLKIHKK